MANVSPQRKWNTWQYQYPGALTHADSGITLRCGVYSGTSKAYHDFCIDKGADVRFGSHPTDGSYSQVTFNVGSSQISFETGKVSWFTTVGRLETTRCSELPFRFELLLELGVLHLHRQNGPDAGVTIEFEGDDDETLAPQAIYAIFRSQVVCLVTSPRPFVAAAERELGDYGQKLERSGWQYTGVLKEHRDGLGSATLRFMGDPRTPVLFALSQGTDRRDAKRTALAALLNAEAALLDCKRKADRGADAYKAVRDVIGWNTIWDPINSAPYTSLSRNWISDLGGRGVWLSDVLYNAMMSAYVGDWELARSNFKIVLDAAQPQGNLSCLVSGGQEWVDRTQLPVASYVLYRIFSLTEDKTLLSEAYPILKRQQDWYFEQRDGNKNGILEYGSSPTGNGIYLHTKQGAMNESGMDNLHVFDDVVFNKTTHTLEFEEVGHNSLIAMDAEFLSRIASTLGLVNDASELAERSRALRIKISTELWDETRAIFAGRHWNGAFADGISPTSFFPLAAGAATQVQADTIIRQHLLNPEEFWGRHPLPSTPFSDPISLENMYWRGRCWPPLNLFVWEGLRRYGYHKLASELAERGWDMFNDEWSTKRHCRENFHICDPEGHSSNESDPFYSWGALLPFIYGCDAADVSPWNGVSFAETGGGRLELPGRLFETRASGSQLDILMEDSLFVTFCPPVRIENFEFAAGKIYFTVKSEKWPVKAKFPSQLGSIISDSSGVSISGNDMNISADVGRVCVQFSDLRRPHGEEPSGFQREYSASL